jgi:hypothetical protein
MTPHPTIAPPVTPSNIGPDAEPSLAPPGAGVPRIERMVGWLRLAIATRQGAAAASKLLRREQAAVRRIVQPLSPAEASARVLVPRLRGLEDSSRWWSAWMTLDHLRIVNESIAGVITVLGTERAPAGEASTAAVKPSPDAGPEVLAAFDASCDALERAVAELPRPRSTMRFVHPWFGPLDTAGWHAMAAMHMGIHLAQLHAIVRGLDSSRAGRR